MKTKILVVDDDLGVLEGLKLKLEREYEVETATHAADAEKVIRDSPVGAFQVLITDMRMPGPDGFEDGEAGLKVLKAARRHDPLIQTIVLTGYVEADNAVKAMKAGAFGYVGKSADKADGELLTIQVQRAIEERSRQQATVEMFEMVELAGQRLHGLLAQLEDCVSSVDSFVRDMREKLIVVHRISRGGER